jgi:hypothetical protein
MAMLWRATVTDEKVGGDCQVLSAGCDEPQASCALAMLIETLLIIFKKYNLSALQALITILLTVLD